MRRLGSLEKTPMLKKLEGGRGRRAVKWMDLSFSDDWYTIENIKDQIRDILLWRKSSYVFVVT